ncbi:hypothetical protein FB451DRAFT_1367982 [Mycena latifolia]|nr:hypothetical protein FB451DRAFT_1367982 [Mycena latifolia]
MASIAGPSQAVHEPWIGMLSETKDTPAKHTGTCELCGHQTEHITQHHLYPRATVRKAATNGFPYTPEQKASIAALCWPCHCIVHRLIPNDILASSFHSIELLKIHGGIQAWLHWAQRKSVRDLHSLMIPRSPKITKGKRGPVLPQASPTVQRALETIWAQNQDGFPRWEGKGTKTRGHSLRQQVRRLPGLNNVRKPDIEAAMRANPEWQQWQQWVFGRIG